MTSVRSILIRYPYYILAAISLLLISEMIAAGVDLVPIEHEWILGWLLFLTVLAWIAMAILIGVKAPISHKAMKYAYRILVALLLVAFLPVILAVIGLEFYYLLLVESSSSSFVLVSIFLLPPFIWLGASGLVGVIAPTNNSTKSYLILVILPLVAAASISLIIFLAYVLVFLVLLVLFVLSVGVAGIVFIPTRALISISFGISYRNTVVAVLWTWVMIVGVGWYWVGTMGDGLDAFTGEERAAAKSALYEAHCVNRAVHPAYRVVKDDNGRFLVNRRALWRMPISCGAFPEWID